MNYGDPSTLAGAAGFDREFDRRVRTAAFDWLASQCSIHGEVLPLALLREGFTVGGRQVHVIGPKGIFKPAVMDVPLSITTAPKGPYHDVFGSDNLLRYQYRRDGPDHPDNVGLRSVMSYHLPLVYFHGLIPGKYMPVWPVFVVHDERRSSTFSVAVDDVVHTNLVGSPERVREDPALRREYVTVLTRRRLHQRAFRERVLAAYRHQCALCRLRRDELLDAAHIDPDAQGGEPTVNNGLALCRLHHAAFDRFFLGVRPDTRPQSGVGSRPLHIIEVRPDVLDERDGPTLRHAIQELHGRPIILPPKSSDYPDLSSLAKRYDRFREKAVAS
ncbi:MAG: HNH endonuclease [Gemmatimonadota bacterium]|uniref:HNH endonuclease n=1 Tax=Candidatus Palauibacter scopulicola TaxID=3056741 RepID=UPI00238A6523|nr:HNH endonuclease [Candidatus Palauibacter scopulicola]MDE2662047.1 HNH endonuclease [Candidatus Palauibacter scopulicola]